jgi:hypothetical protein
MNPTLRELLQALFQLSQDNDALRQRVGALETERDQAIALITLAGESLPPGWRLVKEIP